MATPHKPSEQTHVSPDGELAPRIAIVYDRLTTKFGGAERVLQALHDLYPTAPVFTTVFDPHRAAYAARWDVRTSWLQHVPGARRFFRSAVGLMPLAVESLDLTNFDIILSVSSAEAKGVMTKPEQLHVCYLLTPTRYLWSHTAEYSQHPFTGWLRTLLFRYLRWWDEAAALRPDVYIPISRLVAERTRTFYTRRTEAPIYPPVSMNEFHLSADAASTEAVPEYLPKSFWLMVGRLVDYKKVDVAIRATARLGQPLVVVGDGPAYAHLAKIAQITPGAQVFFERSVQPGQLEAYYARCIALLAPGEEDFGIVSLEAQAAGKPVVLHQNSGAAEIVLDQSTGVHIQADTVESLLDGMKYISAHTWSATKIVEQVRQYDTENFTKSFAQKIAELWQKHRHTHLLLKGAI